MPAKMSAEEACEVLGVEADCVDEAALRKAFKRQSLIHHPDKNPGDPDATARFQRVGEALETLLRRARGEDDEEDLFGDDFFRGATQDFDDSDDFFVFVNMMREMMGARFRGGGGGGRGAPAGFSFGGGGPGGGPGIFFSFGGGGPGRFFFFD